MPYVIEHRLRADAAGLDTSAGPHGGRALPLTSVGDAVPGPGMWARGISAALRAAEPIARLQVCALLSVAPGDPHRLHRWDGAELLPADSGREPRTGLPTRPGAVSAVLFGGAATSSAAAFRLHCLASGVAAQTLVRWMRAAEPGAAVDESTGPWPLPPAADTRIVHLSSVTVEKVS